MPNRFGEPLPEEAKINSLFTVDEFGNWDGQLILRIKDEDISHEAKITIAKDRLAHFRYDVESKGKASVDRPHSRGFAPVY